LAKNAFKYKLAFSDDSVPFPPISSHFILHFSQTQIHKKGPYLCKTTVILPINNKIITPVGKAKMYLPIETQTAALALSTFIASSPTSFTTEITQPTQTEPPAVARTRIPPSGNDDYYALGAAGHEVSSP
jgi:hypothetical protein